MEIKKRNPRWKNSVKKSAYAGIHLIADFWFGKTVENPREIKKILLEAARKSGNTPLKFSFYKFSPQGVTGVLLLSESHIAIHSWPEIQYEAIDIFTCGKNTKPYVALTYLKKVFKPKKVVVTELKRGRRK